MNTRSLAECKRILQKSDADTLERRAKRLQELKPIRTDGRLFSSQREWDYASEAAENYINASYRSAIFCYACAVDQIFRYEYVKVPGNKYEDLEKKLTFGQVIRKCKEKNVVPLSPFMEHATLLNDIRNNVATHPLFIDIPAESDRENQIRNQLLCRDIMKLLDLVERVDSDLRHRIESTTLISEVEGKNYILGEVINRHTTIPTAIDGFWGLIQDKILRFLAIQARNIMKTISEGLYGIDLPP